MSLSLRETYEKKIKSKNEKKSKKIKLVTTRLITALFAIASVAAFSSMTALFFIEVSSMITVFFFKKRHLSSSTEKALKKRVIKNSKSSIKSQLTYTTEHYQLYDVNSSQKIESISEVFVNFDKYNDYMLYINLTLKKIEKISIVEIKLNDLTISRVLSRLESKALNSF